MTADWLIREASRYPARAMNRRKLIWNSISLMTSATASPFPQPNAPGAANQRGVLAASRRPRRRRAGPALASRWRAGVGSAKIA